MALGEAAGVAINVCLDDGSSLRDANVVEMQRRLLAAGAVLTYYQDAAPGDAHYEALQFFALRGFLGDSYEAKLDDPVSDDDRENWTTWANTPDFASFSGTRGQLLDLIYIEVGRRTDAEQAALYAETPGM